MADYLAIAGRALKEYQKRKPAHPPPVADDDDRRAPVIEERPAPAPAPAVGHPTWRLAPIPPERQAAEARRRLEERGWCAILARNIGEGAVLILATDAAKVPAAGYPAFTLAEVEALLPGGLPAFKAAYAEKLAAIEEASGHAE